MSVFLTSDTHFGHPLLAVLRGFYNDSPNGKKAKEMLESGMTPSQIHEWACASHISMREIADTKTHDDFIIDSINSCVSEADELWHLGDVSFRTGIEYTIECMSKLNVPIENRHLTIGNHDKCFRGNTKGNPTDFDTFYLKMFATIDEKKIIDYTPSDTGDEMYSGPILLCHFPWLESSKNDEYVRERLLPFYPDRNRYVSHGSRIPLLYGHTHTDNYKEFGDEFAVNVGLDAWDMKPVSLDIACRSIEEIACI